MATVSIQFHPNAFNTGKPCAKFASSKHKVRWTITGHIDNKPDVMADMPKTLAGIPIPPYNGIMIFYGSPTTMDKTAFNQLPYAEYRAAIANSIDNGILQVLDSTGTAATAEAVRTAAVA